MTEERDTKYKIIESAKNILTGVIGVEVDTSQHILFQLEEAVQKFNEDSSGQENLMEKVENKFDNKVLEKIAIQQVELSSILTNLEKYCTNVTLIFGKLCNVTEFTKEIMRKLTKIDDDLKASVQKLQLDHSSSSAHHMKIRFLSNMQA